MSRIRSIKPSVHRDAELWDLEQETGLPIFRAFTGLWGVADREGRFEWKPREMKPDILPYWDGDFEVVLSALCSRSFVVRYEVGGRVFGLVRTFTRHQVVNQREAKSEIPPPPSTNDTGARTETHVHARAEFSGVNVPRSLAEKVFERDGRKCLRCGRDHDLTVDHIFPQCMGGTHAISNLRTLCRSCNSARPVQGEALAADLAKDGLTLVDLQRTCMHVQERQEGKGTGREREQEHNQNAHARDGGWEPTLDFDSRGLEALFSRLRKESGGGTFRSQRSDYDRAQKAVEWAREETPDDPAAACERSIRKFLTHATGKEGDGWPFWGWANDPGKWLAYTPPAALKPPTDFKAARAAAGEATARERLARLDARFDAMIAATADPVEREKLDAEKWEKHNRLDRMLG
jgi:hypothetical protein